MLAFHTEGEPPSSGSTSLAAIGWTMNTRLALAKTVAAYSTGEATTAGRWAASRELMAQFRLETGRDARCGRAFRPATMETGTSAMFNLEIETLARLLI